MRYSLIAGPRLLRWESAMKDALAFPCESHSQVSYKLGALQLKLSKTLRDNEVHKIDIQRPLNISSNPVIQRIMMCKSTIWM